MILPKSCRALFRRDTEPSYIPIRTPLRLGKNIRFGGRPHAETGKDTMPETDPIGPYRSIRFRPERNATLDSLRWAKKRFQIPVLLEVDVTGVREAIRAFRKRTGRGLSFTAWVVGCVARAAAEHPRVHGIRRGRRKLVLFDDVDVAVLVERSIGGGPEAETLPMPVVVRKANERSLSAIHEVIRDARSLEVSPGSSAIEQGPAPWAQSLFFRLPRWVRDAIFWRWLLRNPFRIKRTMGTVVVTSVGMATPGLLRWGVPLAIHPLAVGVGGVAERRWEGGKTELLALTVVFDHAVTDGAPVGRFIHRLEELLRRGEGLAESSDRAGDYPPATAPTTRKGSDPRATSSGSGRSGGS
jgi:hypothetical protein